MTDLERRVANRLKRGTRVLAKWVPPKDNPHGVENHTQVFRRGAGDFVMTGWPNGDYERRFDSAESAAEAFVGTVGSTLAQRALASSRRKAR